MHRRWYQHPVVTTLGGLALGGIGLGFLILLSLHFIVPSTRPETKGALSYQSEHFVLWYNKDSPAKDGHEELLTHLEEELEDLIEFLDVDSALIPKPIDVFVHDDISALQSSIFKRKSGQSSSIYRAPLDLLIEEAPRGRLAELVLAFGWGECHSQILQIGMRLLATFPERNLHAAIAALPERLFIFLSELVAREDRGFIPETIYQIADSPYSSSGIGSLTAIKEVLDLSTRSNEVEEDLLVLGAGSFVQFLVETRGGIDIIRQAWGRGGTEFRLKQITSDSMTQLGQFWATEARNRGETAPDYPYWRAYYLLGSGEPDAAYREARPWADNPSLTERESFLLGQCGAAVGAFDELGALFQQAQSDVTTRLEQLSELYGSWTVREAEGMRLLFQAGVEESAEAILDEVKWAYSEIRRRLAFAENQLPERLTIFVYTDVPSRDRGSSFFNFSIEQSAIFHVVQTEDIVRCLGEALPSFAWGKRTYSSLLRTGLVKAVFETREDLVAEGCRLLREGRWISLDKVSFQTGDQATVEIETGLFIDYLLVTFGIPAVRAVWIATSPLGRYLSLETALEEICGTTRGEIEEALRRTIRCH